MLKERKKRLIDETLALLVCLIVSSCSSGISLQDNTPETPIEQAISETPREEDEKEEEYEHEEEDEVLPKPLPIDPPIIPERPAEPLFRPYGNIDPPNENEKWEYVWGDEFSDSTLDRTKWNYTPINWQRKTRTQKDNCVVKWNWQKRENIGFSDGNLVLKNTKEELPEENDQDVLVSASAIYSRGIFETTYGYFEARIRIAPPVSGIHTAFWLIGNSKEIDILESVHSTNHYSIAIHWNIGGGSRSSKGKKVRLDSIHDAYNIFGFYWTENEYKFYANGELKFTFNNPNGIANLDKYIYLSTGAHWRKIGSACTGSFPNEALVDYIRVWKSIEK